MKARQSREAQKLYRRRKAKRLKDLEDRTLMYPEISSEYTRLKWENGKLRKGVDRLSLQIARFLANLPVHLEYQRESSSFCGISS